MTPNLNLRYRKEILSWLEDNMRMDTDVLPFIQDKGRLDSWSEEYFLDLASRVRIKG